MQRFVNADILIGDVTDFATLNRYAYANGNPVSNVDPFGLAVERGGDISKISSDLEGLYGLAYNYYGYVYNKKDRINFANDAVMKYIIYQRFYKESKLKGEAWGVIAGPLDLGFIEYMNDHTEYSYLQGKNFTFKDPSSGNDIDFSHLIAVLNANTFDRIGMGWIDKDLNAYAGWAGDLITLAGDAQNYKNSYPKANISKFVQNSLNGMYETSFSTSDLLSDIDAVLLSSQLKDKPIFQAFNDYYSSDTSFRYNRFVEKYFDGYPSKLENTAQRYLMSNSTNAMFRIMFDAKYSDRIINSVASGFTDYIIMNLK